MTETGKYCPICGREVSDLSISRFGEYFDSADHAEQYVKEVRARRLGQTATPVLQEQAPRRPRGGCC